MSDHLKGTPPPIQWTEKEDGRLYPPTIEQIQAYQEWYEAQGFPKPDVQTMSLQEKVNEIIMGCVEVDDDNQLVKVKTSEATPAILALFREAMTSDEAIRAASTSIRNLNLAAHDKRAKAGITAALDAAMKED